MFQLQVMKDLIKQISNRIIAGYGTIKKMKAHDAL